MLTRCDGDRRNADWTLRVPLPSQSRRGASTLDSHGDRLVLYGNQHTSYFLLPTRPPRIDFLRDLVTALLFPLGDHLIKGAQWLFPDDNGEDIFIE